MNSDHLDKETSISAELTPSGVKASAKSRAIAAIDLLIGSGIDRLSAPLESKTAEIRAKSETRIKLIKSLGELGIKRLTDEPELVAAAFEKHFESIIQRQENKEAVISASLEDLRRNPPNIEQSTDDSKTIKSDFLNRFERYAEEATEEQVREKWGRVLATEIRQPGTFSLKVLRIIDEINATNALLFERICAFRFSQVIPRCLAPDLSFMEVNALVDTELLFDPGFSGQVLFFGETTENNGQKIWTLFSDTNGISIPHSAVIKNDGDEKSSAIIKKENRPAMPVYILTPAGQAISRILQHKEENALSLYIDKIKLSQPHIELREYKRNTTGNIELIRIYPAV